MGSVPIVGVGPRLELARAVLRGGVGPGIGPFSEGGLDEALGLAVGLGRVGSGFDVLEFEPVAGAREGEGFVAGPVAHQEGGWLDGSRAARGAMRSAARRLGRSWPVGRSLE